jgi:hypothetical protein
MKPYFIAAAVFVSIVSMAAIGTFAAEDFTGEVGDETVVALQTETATPEVTETPTDATPTPEDATPTPEDATPTPEDGTPTPEATATAFDGTATPEATGTSEPEPTPTPEDGDGEGGPRDIKGIPTHNPNWTDDDGDGICEKGETKIKTTPSGNQVRVPCHAGKDDEEEEETSGTTGDDDDGKKNKKPKN